MRMPRRKPLALNPTHHFHHVCMAHVSSPPASLPEPFLALPEDIRPRTLARLRCDDVIRAVTSASVPVFATEELRIVAISSKAAPAFDGFPGVHGSLWPEFLRRYWEPEAAEEVIAVISKTLEMGTPYSSLGYTARRADGSRATYNWEVHRIVTADRRRMLLCYFAGPS